MKTFKEYINENEYHINHRPADKESGSPIYDLNGTYPDDIYSSKGAQYYGHHGSNHPQDVQTISLIHQLHNKPNASVKIYRAVPDNNLEIKKQLKPLLDIVNYYSKFKFFPMKNSIIYQLREKYPVGKYKYDEQEKLIFQDISKQIENLEAKKLKPITINIGDWITVNRDYAVEHGESSLEGKYKIISKVVKAKDLFTSGDSIHEWGYFPETK